MSGRLVTASTLAPECVCGPGDVPMSVVGTGGADCVVPAGATYSAGPLAVPVPRPAWCALSVGGVALSVYSLDPEVLSELSDLDNLVQNLTDLSGRQAAGAAGAGASTLGALGSCLPPP